MQTEPKIVFEGMGPSDAVRARVLSEVGKLETFNGRITACRVVIEAPDRHKTKGGLFRTKVFLTMPGGVELVVDHNRRKDHAHEDVYVSIRDAFAAARRRLQDHGSKREGRIKSHEAPPTGRIKLLKPEEDYGIIETAAGFDVYFHRNAVVTGAFDKLAVGDEVRFHEELGAKGPQASSVHVLGKHHPG